MDTQKLKKEIKNRRFHRIFFFVSYLSPIVFLKYKKTTINKELVFFLVVNIIQHYIINTCAMKKEHIF
jgi:hypothetical protein